MVGSLLEKEVPNPHLQVMLTVKPLSLAVVGPRNHSEADELNAYYCSKPVGFARTRLQNADLAAGDHSDTDPQGSVYQWEQILVAKEPH